jgi:hypothetical protein
MTRKAFVGSIADPGRSSSFEEELSTSPPRRILLVESQGVASRPLPAPASILEESRRLFDNITCLGGCGSAWACVSQDCLRQQNFLERERYGSP